MIVACPGCHRRYDVSGRPAGTDARCSCGRRFQIPKADRQAVVQQCPQCGGALDPHATACCYCQSPVAQVRCPRCLGRVAPGGRHCQHCGTAVEVAAQPLPQEGRTAQCPRCRDAANLESLLVQDLVLDHCPECSGVWLDHNVFAKLQTSEASGVPVMLRVAQLPSAPSSTHSRAYVPCPECSALMTPRNFAGCSGVIVDECKNHGVWFDAGELAAILQFVREGGLDRARDKRAQALSERQRAARLDVELSKIRDARIPQATSRGGGWSLSDAASLLSDLFG